MFYLSENTVQELGNFFNGHNLFSVNQPQWRSNGNVQRTQEIPNNQFRKLQLQEDDQNLMNRFKNQGMIE